jgi:hypothetical protein
MGYAGSDRNTRGSPQDFRQRMQAGGFRLAGDPLAGCTIGRTNEGASMSLAGSFSAFTSLGIDVNEERLVP